MRAAGEQAKTTCGNMRLCAGLRSGIEGAKHAVGQRRREREMQRRSREEAGRTEEEEENEEEAREDRLMVETERTEEEAAEILELALGMEVDGEG